MPRNVSHGANVGIFIAFLAFVGVVMIGPSLTGLLTKGAEQGPTGMSSATLFAAWLLPVGVMAAILAFFAFRAIEGCRDTI